MSRINQLAINDEGFVFDPVGGSSFTVNKSGLFILNAIKQGLNDQQIIEGLAAEFDDTPEEMQRDLDDFIGRLKSYRLV